MKFKRKQLVLASLVLALGAAVYLSWQFSEPNAVQSNTGLEESSQLGVAQLVNNTYVETNTGEGGEATSAGSTAISEARLSRQSSRDEAMEVLNGVLANVDADSQAKEDAATQASAIAQNIMTESNVESLLTAKGFSEAVAFINNEECSVVLQNELQDSEPLIIQEIVMEQTGLSADKIKIITTK